MGKDGESKLREIDPIVDEEKGDTFKLQGPEENDSFSFTPMVIENEFSAETSSQKLNIEATPILANDEVPKHEKEEEYTLPLGDFEAVLPVANEVDNILPSADETVVISSTDVIATIMVDEGVSTPIKDDSATTISESDKRKKEKEEQ